jgi:hypothetical protein
MLLLRQCIWEHLHLILYSVSDSTRSGIGKLHHLQPIEFPGADGYKKKLLLRHVIISSVMTV